MDRRIKCEVIFARAFKIGPLTKLADSAKGHAKKKIHRNDRLNTYRGQKIVTETPFIK